MESGLIKKNTYSIAASYGGQLLLAFFLTLVAAKKLGAGGFGIYMFASIMGYFLLLFDDLGLVTYMVREISKNREKTEDYYINALTAKWIILIFLIPVIYIYMKLSGFGQDKFWSLMAFFVFGFFFSLNQVCYAVYRAHERMHFEMALNLFEKLLITGAGAFVLMKGGGVVAFCAVFGGASIINYLVNSTLVKTRFLKSPGHLQWHFMIRLLRSAFFFGVFWILTNIHERVDVLLLEHMTKSDEIVGWYTLAYKLILVANLIPIVLMTAAFPRISQSVHNNPAEVERLYRLGMKYLFYIALPMVVGTLFLAEPICLFFGDDFQKSGNVLRILILSSGIDFFNIYFSAFLMAWNKQRSLTLLQGVALILNILVNITLIPTLKHIGAAYATLASRGLIFALCAIWVIKRLHNLDYRAMMLSFISTGFMAGYLFLFNGPLFWRIGLASVIYFGLLFLMGGIRSSELLIIQSREPVKSTKEK
jgi:O-antigen/teichoic acid export membrane protein